MKIYLFTDLEGATGVVNYDYGDPERRRRDREFLIGDINAAIASAYDCGAESVVVYDGHGKDAVQSDKLDPRATLIRRGRVESYIPGLDRTFTHFILIGFHSMAGSGGLLNHTHSRRVRRIILNRQEIGEIGLSFIYANYYGVKPIFISGDDKAVEEAKLYLSDIEGAIVKRSISERCGECFPPEQTFSLIYNGVKKALAKDKSFHISFPDPPYWMEVIYKNSWVAIPRYLIRSRFNGVTIKNLYTIRYKDEDFVRLMNKFIGLKINRVKILYK